MLGDGEMSLPSSTPEHRSPPHLARHRLSIWQSSELCEARSLSLHAHVLAFVGLQVKPPSAGIWDRLSYLCNLDRARLRGFGTRLDYHRNRDSRRMGAFMQKGLKNVLRKSADDVVILSALRTPVTRSYKGGLKDAHDHELLYHV